MFQRVLGEEISTYICLYLLLAWSKCTPARIQTCPMRTIRTCPNKFFPMGKCTCPLTIFLTVLLHAFHLCCCELPFNVCTSVALLDFPDFDYRNRRGRENACSIFSARWIGSSD